MRRIKFGSNGTVKINDAQIEIKSRIDTIIQKLEVVEGTVAVQTTSLVEEDWSLLSSKTSLSVKFTGREGSEQRTLNLADSIDMEVTIIEGYKEGDLLWVYLPEALSRVYGGGQLKMFSIDFAGKNTIVIPLAATGSTLAADGQVRPQHLSVCLRNMFDEERCGNPGLIPITVQ